MLNEVNTFIDENILHSKVWDMADDTTKKKAINNAKRTLTLMLPNYYKNEVPVEHVAEQCIWMLKIDDSIQRSELGVTYIQVDGVSMNISEKDRSIAPFICKAFNLPVGFNKRRVGTYSC